MSWLPKSLSQFLGRLKQHETEGQGLVEYAMLIFFIAIACTVAVTALGTTMKTVFWDFIQDVLIPTLGG